MSRIGIRREDKSPFERRAALTPVHVRRATEELGLEVLVQPSPIRVYTDAEYEEAGARIIEDLSTCDMILGVKEVPSDLLLEDQAYTFFSHTVKGQAYNMEMLRTLMERRCTLIDYERIVDDQGRRLVFFGYYAGLAGMLDTLWALGQRALADGLDSPFAGLERAYLYHDLDAARAAVEEVGRAIRVKGIPYDLQPLVIGYAGYGNVSRGAQSIGDHLPTVEVTPEQLAAGDLGDTHPARTVYKVVFKEEHMVRRRDGGVFLLQEYYDHPELYEGSFEDHLDRLTVLVNCIYWEERYPRLMTLEKTRAMWSDGPPRLKVVGDISCDIDGSVQPTVKAATIDKPVFVWDLDEEADVDGVEGRGPVIMSVDILPAELPRDASRHFGDSLMPFLKDLGELDSSVPFERAKIPPEIRAACLLWAGGVTPDYQFMEDFV